MPLSSKSGDECWQQRTVLWVPLRRSECGEANGVVARRENALRVEFEQREDRAIHFEHFAEARVRRDEFGGCAKMPAVLKDGHECARRIQMIVEKLDVARF